MKRFLAGLIIALCSGTAWSAVVESAVEYTDGETPMRGYLYYDDAVEGQRPGVLVVHEWWGLNDYARRRARMLAEQGYVALAVDMYGEGKQAAHPQDAAAFASAVMEDLPTGRTRLRAARLFLEAQPQTDPYRIAAIGYCFGGAVVLSVARQGDDLKLVASFHGSLKTESPASPGGVLARVLVYHGGADAMISAEEVETFRNEMKEAEADFDVVVYPGAKHSFTVPEADAKAAEFGLPIGYDAAADPSSWANLLENLARVFKTESPGASP